MQGIFHPLRSLFLFPTSPLGLQRVFCTAWGASLFAVRLTKSKSDHDNDKKALLDHRTLVNWQIYQTTSLSEKKGREKSLPLQSHSHARTQKNKSSMETSRLRQKNLFSSSAQTPVLFIFCSLGYIAMKSDRKRASISASLMCQISDAVQHIHIRRVWRKHWDVSAAQKAENEKAPC